VQLRVRCIDKQSSVMRGNKSFDNVSMIDQFAKAVKIHQLEVSIRQLLEHRKLSDYCKTEMLVCIFLIIYVDPLSYIKEETT
jgi:hypothetical protein